MLILLLAFAAFACEPMPGPGLCSAHERVRFPKQNMAKLREALAAYDNALDEAVKRNDPEQYAQVGSGDCFLMNDAVGYLKQLEEDVKGKDSACPDDPESFRGRAEALLDPRSEEASVVKNSKDRAILEKLRSRARELLNAFRTKVDCKYREVKSGAKGGRWVVTVLSDSAVEIADAKTGRTCKAEETQISSIYLADDKAVVLEGRNAVQDYLVILDGATCKRVKTENLPFDEKPRSDRLFALGICED